MNLAPLFAIWTLGSGLMLFWSLTAIAPIVIHLWSRRRYREETWAAMEFLLAAMRKHSRRIRIEQLILLAIRTLILVMLGLALADPIFSFLGNIASGVSGSRTHWIIVVDGSYSMDYLGEESRFRVAKKKAQQLVQQARQGDGFTLVLMADPPQVVISRPAFDKQDIQDEISGLRLRHAGADLTATLAEVQQIVESVSQQHKRLQFQQIAVFSDMGNSTWEKSSTEVCRRRLVALEKKAKIALYDVGHTGVENVAITQLNMKNTLVTAKREVVVDAQIRNFGTEDRSSLKVEFSVDGSRMAERSFDVKAGEQATVSWTHQFVEAGDHWIEAKLSADNLPVDNRRWLSVPVRESIQVLCIRGKPGAARHVALALDPTRDNDSRVKTRIEPENALLELDLREFDAVFLCNVGRLGRDEAIVLKDFVNSGGGLVVCVGDPVQADSYNDVLGINSENPILPAKLESVVTDAQVLFDPLEYAHSIVGPFRGFERTGLLTTPTWRYFKAVPSKSEGVDVALGYTNGDPAIVVGEYGKGRSILLTTAVSSTSLDRNTNPPTRWSEFSTWPSFPPLVQEILDAAVAGQTVNRNRVVGEPLQGIVATADAGVPRTISGPHALDGGKQRLNIDMVGDQASWVFSDTWWTGIYNAELAPPVESSQRFSINLEATESDLARFDTDLLPSQIQLAGSAGDSTTGLPTIMGEVQYFRWILVTLFLLLAVESFLAWKFGGTS